MDPIRSRQAAANSRGIGAHEDKAVADANSKPITEATINRLAKHEVGWKLLQAMTWLNPDFVPEEILLGLVDNDRAQLSAVIEMLERLFLASVDEAQGGATGIKLHNGVLDQTVKYMAKYPNKSTHSMLILQQLLQVLNELLPYVTSNPDEKWIKAKLYLPSIESVLKQVAHIDLNIACINHKLGAIYDEIFVDFKKALSYKKQALQIKRTLYKSDHPEIAASLLAVGIAYEVSGNIRNGLDCKEQALKIRQALYKDDHPEVADSLNAVGVSYHALGDIRKGLDYLERGLKMRQVLYPYNHPEVAASLNNMAVAYHALGDIGQGFDYSERALVMRQALYESDHPSIADSLNNVGIAYEALGDIEKGLDYQRQALKMRYALYKDTHPEVAASLNNVGTTYHALGDIKKALHYSKLAYQMMLVLYGDAHPSIAASLVNVGITSQALGDPELNFDSQMQALIMRQGLYEGAHQSIVDSLNNVGLAYEALGHMGDGLYYFERSLEMMQILYPSANHPGVADSLNTVAIAYKKLGDIGKFNLYEKQSGLLECFINKRSSISADIIKVKQKLQKKLLNTIQDLSAKGEWNTRYMGLNCGVSGYLEESYLKKQLGKLSNDKDIKIALALCFEAIAIGIANSEEQNLNCATGFAMAYPELTRECALEHPEYFVLERIAVSCLEPADYDLVIAQAPSNAESKEAFKGEGTLGYAGKIYYEYYNTAIDRLLSSRLEMIDTRVKRLNAWYLGKELTSVSSLAHKVSDELSNNDMVLTPINLQNKHWVGLLFKKSSKVIEVIYMDSEQKAILPGLMLKLQNSLLSNRYESRFLRLRLEKQNYNNCGPELIENFVYYLTGTRATQEGAVYLHSLLLENSLLDPKEYGLKLEENNKLIGFLSNKAPIPIQIPIELPIGGTLAINLLPAVNEFNKLAIKWLYDRLQEVNIVLYKATLGFKALDFTIDSARLLLEPGLDNAKKVALDASYLYSMYSGVNGYSALVSYAEAAYQIHMGEYRAAFDVAAGTISAMALPYILTHANRPYLSLAYGAWVVANTAYSAIANAYSFALELAREDIAHRSTMAYKELAEYLEMVPLQATGKIFDYVVVDLDSNNP